MRMWLDVQVGTTTTGPGPVVQLARFSAAERLNQAGTWSALVPATDARAVDLLQPRRTVLAWGWIDGVKRFLGGGVIQSLRVRIGDDGEAMLEVSGQDLLEEFNRAPVGDVSIEQPGGAYKLADYIADGLPSGWSGGTLTGTPPSFVARFVYDTFLGGLAALADKFPIWFRRSTSGSNPRNLDIYLTLPSTVALYAVANADPIALESNKSMCLITEISEERHAADIVGRVIAFGAGNGDARLTMALATQWPNGASLTTNYIPASGITLNFNRAANNITNGNAQVTYGDLARAIAWKDIAPISNNTADLQAAANTLVAAGCQYLINHRLPVTAYSLSVVGVRQEIFPGDLVHVTARKFVDGETPINIDADLRVLEVRTEMDANGLRTTGLTVATVDRWPESDADALVQDIRQSRVMESLPQMGPSVDTISYREPIDDNYSADLRFWLGNETTTINQVLVRFRVDPFRSTAKTVGGTVSGSVDIPSHTHSVTIGDHTHSVTIGNHTHTTPNHAHSFRITGGTTPTYPIGFGAAGTAGGLVHNASGSDFNYPTNSGEGGTTSSSGGGTTVTSASGGGTTVTSSSGGGQTGLSIDISAALSLEYGIYEDSSGNTYAASDLEWLVNGSAASGTPVATSSGWYELDITADVVAADGLRPAQAANTVTVRVKAASKTNKRCQVTAQIERRTVIQAIAYS